MLTVRAMPDSMLFALVAERNKARLDGIGTYPHLDKTASANGGDYRAPTVTVLAVTLVDASTTPTAVALVNQIKSVLNKHYADAVAHDTVVSAAIATIDATDEATAITLANACKAAYGTHRAAVAGNHYTADSTNTIAAANATDTASLYTLLNELKVDVSAHIAYAPPGYYLNIVDP